MGVISADAGLSTQGASIKHSRCSLLSLILQVARVVKKALGELQYVLRPSSTFVSPERVFLLLALLDVVVIFLLIPVGSWKGTWHRRNKHSSGVVLGILKLSNSAETNTELVCLMDTWHIMAHSCLKSRAPKSPNMSQ